MSSSSAIKWVAVLLSVLVTAVGYAVPTPKSGGGTEGLCPSYASHQVSTPPAYPRTDAEILEPYNFYLAGVAAELLKPPTDLSAASYPAEAAAKAGSTSSVQATTLPAVPSAVFMVLTGFLCVSLVKDRKVWLAALAALLWAGQAGFSALPQLAHHIASSKQTEQFSPANLTCTPELLHSDRLRSDMEGTRYIGLLRHLAGIPPTGEFRISNFESGISNLNASDVPEFALVRLYAYTLSATKRLVYISKRHSCFSAAFTFENLPRGPPRQTWKRFFLLCNFELQSVFANTLTKLRYICK